MNEPINLTDKDSPLPDDLHDMADLLDVEFIAACKRRAVGAPSIEEVRHGLSGVPGSLSDLIVAERTAG